MSIMLLMSSLPLTIARSLDFVVVLLLSLRSIHNGVGLQVWDPRRNLKDRLHMFPIITHAYPCMNFSYNVTASTLRIMTGEFQRGKDIDSPNSFSFYADQLTSDNRLMSCRLWNQTKLTGIPFLNHFHSLKLIKPSSD